MFNPWVGQHAGKEDPRRVRISPFFYSQRKLNNILYIPKLRDLPQSGLDLKAMVFDFGFVPGSSTLGPKGTQKVNLQIERPFMAWALTGVTNEASVPQVSFLVQFFHTHDNSERQFFTKHIDALSVLGSGQVPLLLRYPYLVIRGDQLTCEVKNLSNNANNPAAADTKIQVVLWGGEFD